MVSDLIENGNYDLAMQYLTNYKDESHAILLDLESVPLENRQAVIITLLDQKLADLQMLRILAVDVDAQTLQEMSMIILSLREREMNHLSDFFAAPRTMWRTKPRVKYTQIVVNLCLGRHR